MSLRWSGIVRLGLVQAALGSVVVLVTSTLNRVMVVEYQLPAMLPGLLVALHYMVQMIRPRFGHGSDVGGRRTPWIVGGMALLSGGGVVCAVATVLMAQHPFAAVTLAVGGYTLVGLGVGAAGTSLLVVLAKQVDAPRRAAAASIMWVLMIAGFAITSLTVSRFLDPFSARRLVQVVGIAAAGAFVVALCAVWGVESSAAPAVVRGGGPRNSFKVALFAVWRDDQARRFTWFVFVSMLAYSAQELLLEPFAGLVLGYTLGQSATLAGLWHAAVFFGMVCVGILGSGARRGTSLRAWTIGGCCASAVAILGLAAAGVVGTVWAIKPSVMLLGFANGIFAVSAIGSMMELAHRRPDAAHSRRVPDGRHDAVLVGDAGDAGVRMGLWGAAQAVAFALGGVISTGTVDLVRHVTGSPTLAFATVFGLEAMLFLVAARFAARVGSINQRRTAANSTAVIA